MERKDRIAKNRPYQDLIMAVKRRRTSFEEAQLSYNIIQT